MKIRILSVIIYSVITFSEAFSQTSSPSFQIVGGDSVVFSPNLSQPVGSRFSVKNISGSFKTVRVFRQIINNVSGHTAYFCWGPSCYVPATNLSPDNIPLDVEEIDTSFVSYVKANGNTGNTEIRYYFQDSENPTDQIALNVKYIFGTTSIRPEGPPGRSSAVEASYDAYNKTIHVVVNGGKIDVMNMLGQQVPLNFRYDGIGMTADASTLKTGYYFLFGKNERGPWSARVVVNKQ